MGQIRTKEDVETAFTYQRPHGDQPHRYEAINGAAKVMAVSIISNCPESPERTLAIRKLQEARMWANASIAINEKGE